MQNFSRQEKFNNFSELSDQECAALVQYNLEEALENEDGYFFEWELISKMILVPYELRENICRLFNAALKRNSQKIGNYTISQWLASYIKKYENIERNYDTFLEFILSFPEATTLNKQEQVMLMRVLRIYDYLFVTPFFDLEDASVASIIRMPLRDDLTIDEIQRELHKIFNEPLESKRQKIAIQSVLKEALQKYPKIGEQAISSAPLNIKIFDRPVRPSIRNWLYDYTSQLGQGPHDSMQRTNYLFRSENTKNLSSTEREKLGIILKSFDENTPLPIDTENNEVVFENIGTQNLSAGGHGAEHITPVSYQNPAEESFFQAYPRTDPGPAIQSRPIQNNFVRTFQPPTPPRPIQKTDQSSAFPPRRDVGVPKSQAFPAEKIQFVNPYPAPETHEVSSAKPEMAGKAPVKLKGFSEGVLKPAASPAAKQPQPQKPKVSAPPKQPWAYTPRHPRNMIYPHYGAGSQNRPDPRVEGNIVDLSQQ